MTDIAVKNCPGKEQQKEEKRKLERDERGEEHCHPRRRGRHGPGKHEHHLGHGHHHHHGHGHHGRHGHHKKHGGHEWDDERQNKQCGDRREAREDYFGRPRFMCRWNRPMPFCGPQRMWMAQVCDTDDWSDEREHMQQKINFLKQRNHKLRQKLKKKTGDERNTESTSDSSESEEAFMGGCDGLPFMKGPFKWNKWWAKKGGSGGCPKRFFKGGFGPRGHVWRQFVQTGPIEADNIKAKIEVMSNGNFVVIEGNKPSPIQGLADDTFRRTLELPKSVNEQTVQVIYRCMMGGCLVVRARRRNNCNKKTDIKMCDNRSKETRQHCNVGANGDGMQCDRDEEQFISDGVGEMELDDSCSSETDDDIDGLDTNQDDSEMPVEEEFEIVVNKKPGLNLTVQKMSQQLRDDLSKYYFYKRVALNEQNTSMVTVSIIDGKVLLKSNNDENDKQEILLGEDVKIKSLSCYADEQGIIHLVGEKNDL